MPTPDNAKTGVGSAINPVTITSFTIGSGANRMLLVGISYYTGAGAPSLSVSGVTFNTTSNLTFLDSNRQAAFSGQIAVEFWYLKNPPSTTGDIVVTFTSAPAECIAGGASWSDVEQGAGAFGTVAKHALNGTNEYPTVTVTSETGSVVQDVHAGGDKNVVPVATGTQLWNTVNSANASRGLAQYKAGAASVVMNFTTQYLAYPVSMGVSLRQATTTTFSGTADFHQGTQV